MKSQLLLALVLLAAALACRQPENLHGIENTPRADKLTARLVEEYRMNPVRFERDHLGRQVKTYGRVRKVSPKGELSFGVQGLQWLWVLNDRLVCAFGSRWDVVDVQPKDWAVVVGSINPSNWPLPAYPGRSTWTIAA